MLICCWVIIEFAIIIWSSGGQPSYRGIHGLVRFLVSISCICDFIIVFVTICIFYQEYVCEFDGFIRNNLIYYLRLGQWFHILRLGFRFESWRMMISVIWTQRYQFLITFYMCFVWLIFVALIMYLIEQTNPDTDFTSIPKTFWWSIVSLFTIGYGDMTPSTNLGKVMASIFFFLFIFKFALPGGVLSTGLALKVNL